MSVMGLVLAGGQSTRFGSDKALAVLGGDTLLARAVATLSAWCETVVIAGRDDAAAQGLGHCIPDWPRPGLGPLAGIAAGLAHARAHGFASVLSCGVDSVGLPPDTLDALTPPSAYLASQPVIGHWLVDAEEAAVAILQSEGRRSMLAYAARAHARPVNAASTPANINTPADLARIQAAELEHK
ncbi:molybdenum cofactor guanylyltransferase [Alteraurantiacibacter palmitatis]|uniref:Molybdenum cofactor guanylyltransferase n=1 Tax=Alteraurantiacibacter palmitatis TaxID=2054628 RepID=A0ABV7E2P8_9SPHN